MNERFKDEQSVTAINGVTSSDQERQASKEEEKKEVV